jgi:Ala-tRNA(Pro) deacylase
MQFLGVRPGAVSPLTLVNDNNQDVQLVMDQSLLDHTKINVHPLVNDKTITMAKDDLDRIFEKTGHLNSRILI